MLTAHLVKRGWPSKVLEKKMRELVKALYRSVGCNVWDLEQAYHRGGNKASNTPGIPDLYVQCPRIRCTWFHEVKGIGTSHSKRRPPAQIAFRDNEAQCDRVSIIGGWDEAAAFLVERGIAKWI